MSVTDGQIEDFVNRVSAGDPGFSEADRTIIQHMAMTISRQGQAIYKLSRELQDGQLFMNLAKKAVLDSGVDKLPALLGKAVGADYDFEAARNRITEMNREIDQANDFKRALEAVFKFVTFIAPMLCVQTAFL